MSLSTPINTITTPDITRPARAIIDGLHEIGSATASGELYRLGIKNPHLVGLTTWNKGKSVVGPALTLQWMPKREDMSADHEYADNDGAIVAPVQLAPELIKKASEKNEWEEFTRLKLAEGGDMRKYYPLNNAAQAEYAAWRAKQPMRRLWTQSGPVTFEGAHYRVQDAYLEPKPRPIPPILIGGSGKRLLNIAARYADWWNMTEITLEQYADRVRALRAACEQIGRDPASIRPTWWGRVIVAKSEAEALRQGAGKWTRENALVGTPEQIAEQMQAFAAAGASYFMTIIPELPDPDVIGMLLADVLPKVRAAAGGR